MTNLSTQVTINGTRTNVEYIAGGRGIAMIWKNGVCQTWRCVRENGRWLPTYQIS